jgi:hypothetical protein
LVRSLRSNVRSPSRIKADDKSVWRDESKIDGLNNVSKRRVFIIELSADVAQDDTTAE